MVVTVRLFASLRDAAGVPQLTLEAADPLTVSGLMELIAAKHPALRAHLARTRVAVGQEFASPADRIPMGAEIALLPPVSGG
ncbi:MAG: MoaD/ThiS family protein [Planctomycetes bacterium]|nr:MoaD/ThiS family protein [Planctomycetota bacterium]